MWNGQYMDFRLAFGPWFYRGGGYYGGSDAGLFYANSYGGGAYGDCAFRVALALVSQD